MFSLLLKPATTPTLSMGSKKLCLERRIIRIRVEAAALLKNKVFCFCGVRGKSCPCECLFRQKAVQMRDGKRLPAAEEPCLSHLLPPHHAAVSSSRVLCQLVCPWMGVSIQRRRGRLLPQGRGLLFLSNLSIWIPFCSCYVPSLLLFVPSLLPAPSCLDTIPLDSSTRRKPALDIFCPQLLPHLLLAFQVTIPVVKHSLSML